MQHTCMEKLGGDTTRPPCNTRVWSLGGDITRPCKTGASVYPESETFDHLSDKYMCLATVSTMALNYTCLMFSVRHLADMTQILLWLIGAMEMILHIDTSHNNCILSVSWRGHCTQMVPTAISFYCIMERALYTDGSHNNRILSVSWRGHCTQMVPTAIPFYCIMERALYTDGSHSNPILLCHGDNIEHRWFPQ